jgi:hypothetical protein
LNADRDMSLLPREHGAYGQLAFPVVSSLALAGVSPSSVLIAGAVVALFVAHEPLLVLLGRRGTLARRKQGRTAIVWLAAAGALGLVLGLASFALAPANAKWWFGLPLAAGTVLAAVIAADQEKTSGGEVCAALTFSFVAAPMCVAGGADSTIALSVAVVFAATFVTSTLAVRGIILDVRAGGDPRAARTARLAAVMLACVAIAGLLLAAVSAILPWVALAAAVPGLLTATWLALRPPQSSRLRDVGWVIIAASASIPVIFLVFVTG